MVLIPINGDCDLFVSFDTPKVSRQAATWVEEKVGVKSFILPRSNPLFCGAARTAAAGGGTTAEGVACKIHLTVSGFEEGRYQLVVYNYTAQPTPQEAASGVWSCSPGCDELRLGNTVCDLACNTSSCLWDSGDCGYYGAFEIEQICASGCSLSWVGDGYCDEACFNAACSWDEHDCIAADKGCSDGCMPTWIDDQECDELCNNEACGWDGSDCDHGETECYSSPDGTDYRGTLAVTKSGKTCQMWSEQFPQQHTHTHVAFPTAGLGGHNACRNPGAEEAAPWCYTTDPNVRFELCALPPSQPSCPDRINTVSRASNSPDVRYRTLCPVDCNAVLGDGHCDLRCNITSCAYDAGDCGVGKDLAAVLADQGIITTSTSGEYVMIGGGVLAGIGIGLLILRCAVRKIKRDEEKRRGYSETEMKGMDNVDPDDLAADGTGK